MVQMKVIYSGEKRCQLTHQPSQNVLVTDAPKDNNGRGESFSPTDLVASGLISCMLTVMAIEAEKEGISLTNSHGFIIKEMQSNPRKISRLPIELHLPQNLSTEWRARLEQTALGCPVKRSIHPDILVEIQFIYDI